MRPVSFNIVRDYNFMELIIMNTLKNARLGSQLAQIHRQPILFDICSGTRLDGRYLQKKGRERNMPSNRKIYKALDKADGVILRITAGIPQPFVTLWNLREENATAPELFYGNPAWDLGIVLNALNNSEQAETFLRQYLDNGGVQITIIELYAGILYAKINDAINNGDKKAWARLAKNECACINSGKGLHFVEITNEAVARLGLPGLSR